MLQHLQMGPLRHNFMCVYSMCVCHVPNRNPVSVHFRVVKMVSSISRPLTSEIMHQSIEAPTSPLRQRVGDSGGMDALLNKIVGQWGGVIDSY